MLRSPSSAITVRIIRKNARHYPQRRVRELLAAAAVRAHVHERALSFGGAVGVAEILRMGALGRCVRFLARLFVCLLSADARVAQRCR